jgi:hypothetical protein
MLYAHLYDTQYLMEVFYGWVLRVSIDVCSV